MVFYNDILIFVLNELIGMTVELFNSHFHTVAQAKEIIAKVYYWKQLKCKLPAKLDKDRTTNRKAGTDVSLEQWLDNL